MSGNPTRRVRKKQRGEKNFLKSRATGPLLGYGNAEEKRWLMLQADHCNGAAVGGNVSAALPTPQQGRSRLAVPKVAEWRHQIICILLFACLYHGERKKKDKIVSSVTTRGCEIINATNAPIKKTITQMKKSSNAAQKNPPLILMFVSNSICINISTARCKYWLLNGKNLSIWVRGHLIAAALDFELGTLVILVVEIRFSPQRGVSWDFTPVACSVMVVTCSI